MNQAPTLHMERTGSGPALVMLHGWGWHSGVWLPVIPELSAHYELFMIDLPGFGDSPLIEPYDYATIAALIFRQVPDNAIWLGWSLGGMLGFWVAIHHPDRIRYLVTLASSPRFVADKDWPGVPLNTLDQFAQSLEKHYEQTLTDFLDLQLRGSKMSEPEIREMQHQLLQIKTPNPSALQGGLKLLRDTDMRGDLQKIQCESLHVFGKNDMLVHPEIGALIKPSLPNARMEVIPHSGHMPFLTPHFMKFMRELKVSLIEP